MEQHFPQTLEQLRRCHEIDGLFHAVQNLLVHAAHPQPPETLHLFSTSPSLTQAIWKGEQTASAHHRDTLGLSLFKDGLILGIHPSDPTQLRRNVAIGLEYANYSEYAVTRTGSYDHILDAEHLAQFSEHFESITARLGLANIASQQKTA